MELKLASLRRKSLHSVVIDLFVHVVHDSFAIKKLPPSQSVVFPCEVNRLHAIAVLSITVGHRTISGR